MWQNSAPDPGQPSNCRFRFRGAQASLHKAIDNLLDFQVGGATARGEKRVYVKGICLGQTGIHLPAILPRCVLEKHRRRFSVAHPGLNHLSHHHGVGQWHAPWLSAEIGNTGVDLISAAANRLDPRGIMNPHVLLEAEDRLED